MLNGPNCQRFNGVNDELTASKSPENSVRRQDAGGASFPGGVSLPGVS